MTELREQHITREMFECWQQGKMEGQREEEFLRHTGTCTFCAEQFGIWMEENLMEPPAYLKEEITRRTRQIDVQTAVKVKQTSKQMQLMIYSLKVGLAVVASIFLLTVTSSIQNMNMEIPSPKSVTTETHQEKESITDKLNRGSSFVTDALNQMTNGVFR
ncbi:hypothetical protein [Roseburia sp. 499]|uniref:hypothetical protein n=1 Tax=Roseburia sp. 499 TaxID=1261634 RepID=UPI00095358D9|nr:hypothetical protein [Roseburia sp. 499]WVK71083.1 hypothetical protein BIV20_05965 [Roseburia sp. 499]